jgi:DNA-binding beta-propeller fold protein YncE
VTARESNHLLAFDAAKLISKPNDALLASVQVRTSPVGLIFAKNQSRILTADSNRFNYTNTTSGISVVDVRAALSRKSAVLGRIPTGIFPREFAISPDNKIIVVSDYESKVIMVIDVVILP